MHILQNIKATVLVYTMVLVILGVFMATVVLNIAVQLSSEYEVRNIELSIRGIIQSKSDLAMKYARDTNKTGSGFRDIVSCPTSVTMSGSTFSTNLRYLSGAIFCQGTYSGSLVKISFNPQLSDIGFAEYQFSQIAVNSGATTGTFSDGTSFSMTASYPLIADNIDDNFNSDNFTAYSTGTILYPDNYSEDDDESRRLMYGYIIENSGLYNIFWSNSKTKQYINQNTANNYPAFLRLGNANTAHMYLDIDTDFRLRLLRIDKNIYDTSQELVIQELITGTGQIASIGYLQTNLSLSPTKTGTGEYVFDFVNNDYAVFIENRGTGALLYQIKAEHSLTGSGIYINPLKDQDPALFSYLGNHIFIDSEGKLIGDQFEIFGLK